MAPFTQHHEAGRISSPQPTPHPASKSVSSSPLALTGQAPHHTIKRLGQLACAPSMVPRSSMCSPACKVPAASFCPLLTRLQLPALSHSWSKEGASLGADCSVRATWPGGPELPPMLGFFARGDKARQHSPPRHTGSFFWLCGGCRAPGRPPHTDLNGPTPRHPVRVSPPGRSRRTPAPGRLRTHVGSAPVRFRFPGRFCSVTPPPAKHRRSSGPFNGQISRAVHGAPLAHVRHLPP
ncbi:hypothetical protein NDU88_003989 [Pleurodeles waltl]|uniref:Uncharacterized protein n=1 Tax=Pleurodeles waltl TaxID=8319 RepID=A0AAV7W7Q1_PLEWA|nr:hypothetical protein NDU88_003989 [Pleurodeles waltl]